MIGGWRYFDAMLRATWLGLHGPLPHNWMFTGVPADEVTPEEQRIVTDVITDAWWAEVVPGWSYR